MDNESEESIVLENVASLSRGDDREASTTEEEAAMNKVEMEVSKDTWYDSNFHSFSWENICKPSCLLIPVNLQD